MRKLILAFFGLTALVACGKDSGSASKSNGNNRSQEEEFKPVITREDCNRGTKASSIIGSWLQPMKSKQIDSLLYFSFDDFGTFTLSNTCQTPAGSATAQVSVPYSMTSKTVTFEAAESDEGTYEDEKNKVTCAISIERMTVSYEFFGQCLVMVGPDGSKMYALPVNGEY